MVGGREGREILVGCSLFPWGMVRNALGGLVVVGCFAVVTLLYLSYVSYAVRGGLLRSPGNGVTVRCRTRGNFSIVCRDKQSGIGVVSLPRVNLGASSASSYFGLVDSAPMASMISSCRVLANGHERYRGRTGRYACQFRGIGKLQMSLVFQICGSNVTFHCRLPGAGRRVIILSRCATFTFAPNVGH